MNQNCLRMIPPHTGIQPHPQQAIWTQLLELAFNGKRDLQCDRRFLGQSAGLFIDFRIVASLFRKGVDVKWEIPCEIWEGVIPRQVVIHSWTCHHSIRVYGANSLLRRIVKPLALCFGTGEECIADFVKPALGTNGSLGRNVFRGPGFAQVDAALIKRFRMSERFGASLRLDSFNLFNRVNLLNPSTNLNSNTFGRATGARAPRAFQVAAKIEF